MTTTNKNNFIRWFKDTIESLYENKHAGFALLMLSLPLLERYLRSKSGINENPLTDPFYDELRTVFPVLKGKDIAEKFWHVYRNGILHQATLSQQNRNGTKMPDGWLSDNSKDVEIDSNSDFRVNPVKFAKHVMDVIDKDFSNYEAISSSNHPLARTRKTSDGYDGTCGGNST